MRLPTPPLVILISADRLWLSVPGVPLQRGTGTARRAPRRLPRRDRQPRRKLALSAGSDKNLDFNFFAEEGREGEQNRAGSES